VVPLIVNGASVGETNRPLVGVDTSMLLRLASYPIGMIYFMRRKGVGVNGMRNSVEDHVMGGVECGNKYENKQDVFDYQ
jgi:hypothetical protein